MLAQARNILSYKKTLLLVLLLLGSLYPIYRNYTYSWGDLSYERQLKFIDKESPYFNPWQYRVLCPILIEAGRYTYTHSVDKVFPMEKLIHQSNTSLVKAKKNKYIYSTIFILFRLLLDGAIYVLVFYFMRYFIRSRWLAALGVLFISLLLGNGVNDADLSFNTYMDVILYLSAACVIVYKKNPWNILLITALGAMNRETSLLIPFMFLTANFPFPVNSLSNIISQAKHLRFQTITITFLSVLAFFFIFLSIRIYYGFQPSSPVGSFHTMIGLDMLKFNLSGQQLIKSIFENYGAGMLMLVPLVFLSFKNNSDILKKWFIMIFPAWLTVHLFTAVIAESRCFFVPVIMLFVPMLLEKIEYEMKHLRSTSNTRSIM